MKLLLSSLVLTICSSFPLCFGFSSSSQNSQQQPSVVPDDSQSSLHAFNRRSFVTSTLILWPIIAEAIQEPRNVDVGGGFDFLAENSLRYKDVLYPPSMEGLWICDREVTQIEGDQFQASEAWRALGGADKLVANKVESFQTRYIASPLVEGGVVNDRGFEFESRVAPNTATIIWDVRKPDGIEFGKLKLAVKNRSVELPSDKGFGYNELIRIQDGPFTRAVQIKRRYRRSFDDKGNRLVEGLEIMKTFRVLDEVAGTELPTATVKSQIRLRRP
jgi:hypothetical protein